VENDEVTIAAGAIVSVPVRLEADPSKFQILVGEEGRPIPWSDPTSASTINGEVRHLPNEASGNLVFSTGNLVFSTAEQSIKLPYYAALKALSPRGLGGTEITLPFSETEQFFEFLMVSESNTLAPLTSVFQLGVTDEDQGLEASTHGPGDLLAIGVTSDYRLVDSVAETTLYFGIATAAPWTTPQPPIARLQLSIDTDMDGEADYQITATSQGNIKEDDIDDDFRDANDLFRTALFNEETETWKEVGRINAVQANQGEVSPYLNNVLFLPVPASELGLTEANSKFYYSGNSKTSSRVPGQVVDTTDTAEFDLTNQSLTNIFEGEGRSFTPLTAESRFLGVEASAIDPSDPPTGFLVLHHGASTHEAIPVKTAPEFLSTQMAME